MSSAIEPTDNVGSGSNIGANVAVAFARIHTPPPAVPTNIRPLTVGSTTMAVTLPVAPATALPSSVPANAVVSFTRGWGPIQSPARGPVIAHTAAHPTSDTTPVVGLRHLCNGTKSIMIIQRFTN